MNDLRRLLDTAASAPQAPVAPIAEDLARGRDALRHRRRRRGAVSMAGLATLAVIGVGAAAALEGRDTDGDRGGFGSDSGVAAQPSPRPLPSSTAPSQPSPTVATPGGPRYFEPRSVDGRVVMGPYSFDAVPQGWEIQGGTRSFVTMVPLAGAPDRFPDSFLGKVVIMYDPHGTGSGRTETFEGREYVVRGDTGHTTVATTRARKPGGAVMVQFPDDTFTVGEMIEFLSTVEAGPQAKG